MATACLANSSPVYRAILKSYNLKHDKKVRADRKRGLCKGLFAKPTYWVVELTDFKDQPLTRNLNAEGHEFLPFNVQDSRSHKLFNTILDNFSKHEDYANKPEKIEALRVAEQSNPEQVRIAYHSFQDGNKLAGARIFNGSDHFLLRGTEWTDVRQHSDPTTPLEKKYNIRFPERDLPGGAYIWGVGFVTSPVHFRGGVKALLGRLADQLDNDYNDGAYKAFRDTRMIDERKFAIYVNARPRMARYDHRLGFKTVQILPDGMHLLRMDGSEFIRRYINNFDVPATVNVKLMSDEATQALKQEMLQRNFDIQNRFYSLNRLDQIGQRLIEIDKLLVEASRAPHYSQRQWDLWRQYIESLYVFWNSLPEGVISLGLWQERKIAIHNLLAWTQAPDAIHLADEYFSPKAFQETYQMSQQMYQEHGR